MELFFPIIVVLGLIVVMIHHNWTRRGDTGGRTEGHPQYVPPENPENPVGPVDIGDHV